MDDGGSKVDKEERWVSVIIPVFNGKDFLEECFQSIKNQEVKLRKDSDHNELKLALHIQVSVYDDGSTDETPEIIQKWKEIFDAEQDFSLAVSTNTSGKPKGVGYAKNRAVEQSTGQYLCFCDADDIMESDRIVEQYKAATERKDAIVGSRFSRVPEGSTTNFTFWANNLSQEQLHTQIFQSFGPTLVMPTWFCHRAVFNRVSGGFDEGGQGVPEDLIFFYQHLDRGGSLHRVDKSLMIYRYHPSATTFSIKELTIWNTRLKQFEKNILSLPSWSKFTIFGAGKLGRRFFRSLPPQLQKSVLEFADVDPKKVKQNKYEPYPNPHKLKVPIVHYEESSPPYVVCIKTEFAWDPESPFRRLAVDLSLVEGKDYFYFN